jgi:hypothetical protein
MVLPIQCNPLSALTCRVRGHGVRCWPTNNLDARLEALRSRLCRYRSQRCLVDIEIRPLGGQGSCSAIGSIGTNLYVQLSC